jgi:hypothetical protein
MFRNRPFSWRRPSRDEHPGCLKSVPSWKVGLSCKELETYSSIEPDQDLVRYCKVLRGK